MNDFFKLSDVLYFPLCFIVLYAIIRSKAKRQKEPYLKKLYFMAFFYKFFFAIAFTFVSIYYFNGGDSALYYQATKDLRTALFDNFELLGNIVTSSNIKDNSPLYSYFFYDEYTADITVNYMASSSNFFVPKLALIPSLVSNHSFICINLFFSFFALGGAIRLFKTFYYYYPQYRKEIALAVFFLPDVCYWSAGLLKDPICFGAIGYITYGLLNIFTKKKKIGISLLLILVCSYLLYNIKVYILLVLALSVVIWRFAEFNTLIKDKTLRRLFGILTFLLSGLIGYLMITYITSQESAQSYRLDMLMQQSQKQRDIYGYLSTTNENRGGSYFTINSSNPFTLIFGGITATFYRPFLWEIKSPIMLLSAIESFIFLYLTLNFMFRRGVINFFSLTFKDSRTLMCFVFAMVFAMAIGISTPNFGALSRYKIPCLPFYMIMLLLLYRNAQLKYPKWFSKILSYIKI